MPALYINEKDSLHSSLLPCTDANPRAEPTASVLSSHKKLFLSLLAISTVSYSVAYSLSSSVITPTSSSLSTADSSPLVDLSLVQGGAQCVQPSAVPLKKSQEGRSDWVYDEEFKKLEVERFLGSIRIPTQSFDDMIDAPFEGPSYDKRFDPFIDFHRYLEKTFPLVHEKSELAKPNRFNLIYTLKGSEPSLKPLVLTAHQDVVPAETSLDRWTYPPFKGVFDGEIVWGRGSMDCKNTLMAILSTFEHLFANSWSPRRTIVLAFGFDEEIGGPQGASAIGPYLLEKYGENGVAMLVDEGGGGVEERYGKTFLLPGTGEKGNVSPMVTVETAGGHSSTPSSHTSIGLLSRIVVALEDAPLFPPTLHPSSPIYGYLSCLNTHGDHPSLPEWLISGFSSGKNQTQHSLDRLAADFAKERGRMGGEYLVKTAKAATLLKGGHKLNALPESATVTFNTRIDFSQTPDEILSLFTLPILPIAKSFNLTLIAANSSILHSPSSSLGTITLSIAPSTGSLSPAPLTPLGSGKAWEIFTWAGRRVFSPSHSPNSSLGGEGEVIVSPSAATGNTDTKWYWGLTTRNIYRFVPRRAGTTYGQHTVNEGILLKSHLEAIAWYHELVLFADEVEGDEEF